MERHPLLTALGLIFAIFLASFLATFAVVSWRAGPVAPVALSCAAPAEAGAAASTNSENNANLPASQKPAAASTETLLFTYSFNAPGVLYEAPGKAESTSPFWFLDSGAKLLISDGVGETVRGDLGADDPWHATYARTNPTDTDGGRHPQNIFRLLTKRPWKDACVELSFKIVRDNISASPNRNASNGLLLMSRYKDADNLYYAGVRVDGTAIIKKKYRGIYYTMAQTPLFEGTYDRVAHPNLLPHGTWMRLRMETATNATGSVTVRLLIQMSGSDDFSTLLTSTDTGKNFGGTPPLTSGGFVGVRTDFMDVTFKDFQIEGS